MTDQEFDNNIKNIFSESTVEVGEVNWNKFQTQLNKRLFYSFSWNRFNIYYLGALSLSIGAAALWFTLNYFNTEQTPQQISPIETKQEQIVSPNVDQNNTTITEEKSSDNVKKQTTTTTNINTESNSSLNKVKPDTVSTHVLPPVTKTDSSQTISQTPVVLKKKKTIVVAKRDTIIKMDTVRVKKK